MLYIICRDHAGGNLDLIKHRPSVQVLGFDDRVAGLTNPVADGQIFKVGSLYVKVLHTPCHTSGSICFVVSADAEFTSDLAVFTGDTLFLAGCGRFFEGSALQMFGSLSKIAALPKCTKAYVGHEYTVKNLQVIPQLLTHH